MADGGPGARPHLDDCLDYLVDAWRQLPDAARAIDGWDLVEQIDYVEECGAKESLLDVVAKLIARDGATADQPARYEELLGLRGRYGPILEELRRSRRGRGRA